MIYLAAKTAAFYPEAQIPESFRKQLKAINTGHITLAFMPADVVKYGTGKLEFSDLVSVVDSADEIRIKELAYWEHVDLTVAILEKSDELTILKEMCDSAGFTYNHEFTPHITIGTGDLRAEYADLVGVDVDINDVYIKILPQTLQDAPEQAKTDN